MKALLAALALACSPLTSGADLFYSTGSVGSHGLAFEIPATVNIVEIQTARVLMPPDAWLTGRFMLSTDAGCALQADGWTRCQIPPPLLRDRAYRLRWGHRNLQTGATTWEVKWRAAARIECCRYAAADTCVVRATGDDRVYMTAGDDGSSFVPPPTECAAPIRGACR